MHRYALWILLSLISVGGCVKIPTDEAICKMQSPPSVEKAEELALEDSHFHRGDFPGNHWWEMFEDPQLSKLIYQALAHNPTMSMVEARLRTAEAEAKVKRSRLFPTIGFNALLTWEYLGKNDFFRAYAPTIPGNITEYEIDVDFSYEIDLWGKNRNVYRSALGLARAEQAERESTILMLSTSVAAAYFKLQASMEQLELLKKEQKILTHLFDLTNLREENALDNTSDQLSAEEKLLIINKNILVGEQKVALNRHTLNMLLGEGPENGTLVEKISLQSHKSFPLPENISSDLVARRPDLMALIWRVEAAAHLVGAARADFYPRVDLVGLAGLDSVFVEKLFKRSSRTGSLQPAVHLPIFTAGKLKANLKARQAEFEALIYTYNDRVLHAVKEVSDKIVILKMTNENLKVEERLVENRIQDRELMAERYKHAVSNLLDLLESQDLVIKQEFEKIRLEYKQNISTIQLIKALGGGYCNRENPLG